MIISPRCMRTNNLQLIAWIALTLTACAPPQPKGDAQILLFNGTGTSPNDVKSFEVILKKMQLAYDTVDSRQLNGMSVSNLVAYRLFIIPGGNYITMGNSLAHSTTTKVQSAVQGGLNYLGVCAGGLLAGNAACTSLNLTSGVRFAFYAVVNQGIHKAPVMISAKDTAPLEQYWEDGPQFTGWGTVVGKYPDGTPAVVEGECGKGWVLLCGVHPEAPDNWRRGMNFTTPTSAANAYAETLIDAAFHSKQLPHY